MRKLELGDKIFSVQQYAKLRFSDMVVYFGETSKPHTVWWQKFNKLVGKMRFKVERTFGGIPRWMNSTKAKYRGMEKLQTQNLMNVTVYNLYRGTGITMLDKLKNKI